jgi:dihydropteroate synthase
LSGVEQPSERVFGTVGANVVALLHGARLFRVHDVSQNRQALDVAWGIVRGSVALSGSQFPVPGSRGP